jgi:hypothetical protein
MAWRLIDPRLLRQDHPRWRLLWYQDAAVSDGGGLLCWLDAEGAVARFQLVHTPFLAHQAYCLEWQRGGAPRFGVVDDGERTGRCKMTPIVRYTGRDDRVLAALAAYFAANAGVVEWRARAAIALVMQRARRAGAADLAPPPAGPPPAGGVSGRQGGAGDGTAATNKLL